jgi:phosphoribulokinase
MSVKHPIIAITGSSGAGTTSVTRTFENIFRREKVSAAIIEGDSFHRYDRLEMRKKAADAEKQGDKNFSHFGPTTNLFAELETLFRSYRETGTGKRRKYLHDQEEAAPYKQEPGTFTPWEDVPSGTDLVRILADDQLAVVRTARSVFPLADAAQDEPTADLLTQRMQVHEKTAWMLRANLG